MSLLSVVMSQVKQVSLKTISDGISRIVLGSELQMALVELRKQHLMKSLPGRLNPQIEKNDDDDDDDDDVCVCAVTGSSRSVYLDQD